jgi:hypothetical protein
MTRNFLLQYLKSKNIINTDDSLHIKFAKTLANNPDVAQAILDYTSFLTYDACMKARLHTVLSNITTQPVCETCKKVLKMRMDGRYRYTYPTYCGSKCFSNIESISDARKKTNLEKYGSENALGSSEIRNKIKATNLQKYGNQNAFKNTDVQQKQKNTNMIKYGVEHPVASPQIITKRKATNVQRYGMENPALHPDVIEKKRATVIERYGVDNVFKLQEVQDKADATMIERYGVESPLQLEKISSRFKQFDIPIITRSSSQFELDIGDYIKSLYDGEIIFNTKSVITPLELDIYLPELKLAFECNGVFWHGETQGKSSKYHLDKTEQCNSAGVRLIHILDKEWEVSQDIVKSRLRSLLGLSTKLYARKTIVTQLTYKQYKKFFDETHIQLGSTAGVCYGLMYENEIVAAMSFGKSRYNKQVEWELLRYANKLDTSVIGGASKLFKHFIEHHDPKSITTYSDKRWNTGNMYALLGFAFQHDAKPNYYYFVPENTTKLYHRSQFQKHKLSELLEQFDPNQTEWENMLANGYDRIWDCGNGVWQWNKKI